MSLNRIENQMIYCFLFMSGFDYFNRMAGPTL